MQKLKDYLKAAFPKPQLPQKRYLVLLGLALYIAAKVWVAYTPTSKDDELPDQLRGVLLNYFAEVQVEPDPTTDYDEDGLRYGEGYN